MYIYMFICLCIYLASKMSLVDGRRTDDNNGTDDGTDGWTEDDDGALGCARRKLKQTASRKPLAANL